LTGFAGKLQEFAPEARGAHNGKKTFDRVNRINRN
jgi:hypothetical protein